MATDASPSLSLDWARRIDGPTFPRRMARLARQHPLGVFGLVVLLGFVFLGLFGPHLTPYDPKALSTGRQLSGPSLAHPFGTNSLGQDIFSRVIAGARISLEIAGASIFIGASIGSFLGILAGYYGRWVDYVVQRSSEAFSAFPFLVIYFLLRTAMGTGVSVIIAAIAIRRCLGATASCAGRRLSNGTLSTLRRRGPPVAAKSGSSSAM